METFKNNRDVQLKSWPKSPEEWQDNPEITFTIAMGIAIHPGDRILAGTQMVTSGRNSGSIVDVYYYLQSLVQKPESNELKANVKRLEL